MEVLRRQAAKSAGGAPAVLRAPLPEPALQWRFQFSDVLPFCLRQVEQRAVPFSVLDQCQWLAQFNDQSDADHVPHARAGVNLPGTFVARGSVALQGKAATHAALFYQLLVVFRKGHQRGFVILGQDGIIQTRGFHLAPEALAPVNQYRANEMRGTRIEADRGLLHAALPTRHERIVGPGSGAIPENVERGRDFVRTPSVTLAPGSERIDVIRIETSLRKRRDRARGGGKIFARPVDMHLAWPLGYKRLPGLWDGGLAGATSDECKGSDDESSTHV